MSSLGFTLEENSGIFQPKNCNITSISHTAIAKVR